MNDLPKKIINSLEDLNKYLYSHNYILEFSDVFFMTEQINFNNVELLKHFAANSVDYQKRKIFSIEQDNFKIIFLLDNNFLYQKKYEIISYNYKKPIYDLNKKPHLVIYSNSTWTSKRYYSFKNQPISISRRNSQDSYTIEYYVDYSSNKNQVKYISVNYERVYEIEIITKDKKLVSVGSIIDPNKSNKILDYNLKIKNLESFSKNNKKIQEIMKIFDMIYYWSLL